MSPARAGHGSRPWPQSSVTRLVRALDIIARNPFEPRVIPAVDQYAKARAACLEGRGYTVK